MRTQTPTLHCDGDSDPMDFGCDAWTVDYYAVDASSVDNVRITATTRAPGWLSTDAADLCPDHHHPDVTP